MFFGRTVRTVQRWEKTAGLPVRRGGPGRGAVVASKLELAEWWQHRRDTLAADDESAFHESSGEDGPSSDTEAAPSDASRLATDTRAWPRIALIVVLTGVVGLFTWLAREPKPAANARRIGRVLAVASSEGQAVTFAPLGGTPGDLKIAPDDSQVYVALESERAVAVVDAATLRVVRTIPTIDGGGVLAVAPDGKRLYVGGVAEVGIVDLDGGTADRLAMGGAVHGLQISPDGRRLWVALAQGGLKVIDTKSREITAWPTVGCPVSMAMGSSGRRLYVSYQCGGPGGRSGHDAIEVFDATSGQSLATRSSLPLVGDRLALSPDEQYLWADTSDACAAPQYDHLGCPPGDGAVLHTLRASTLEPVLTVRVPGRQAGGAIAFVPDGSRLVMSSVGLHVVNAALGHVEEDLPLGYTTQPVFTHDGSRMFVALYDTKMIASLPVGASVDARDIGGLGTHWTGDGTANDTAGGTHGTASDGVRYAPGRLGQAFSFDGTTAGVMFGRRIDVDPTAYVSTIAAWIKPDRYAAMALLSRDSFAGWQWRLTVEGRPSFCLATGLPSLGCDRAGLVGRGALTPGAWHHIAIVKSEDRILLYQDGQIDAEASLAGYQPPPGQNYDEEPVMRLGVDRAGNSRFSGLIDEVTMFRRALGASEIAQLMSVTTLRKR